MSVETLLSQIAEKFMEANPDFTGNPEISSPRKLIGMQYEFTPEKTDFVFSGIIEDVEIAPGLSLIEMGVGRERFIIIQEETASWKYSGNRGTSKGKLRLFERP